MSEWQPIATAPRDGQVILLWVCTRDSIRRGWSEICWRGEHPDWGDAWLRNEGKDIVGEGVATHWMPLHEPPEPATPALDASGRDDVAAQVSERGAEE